MPKLVEKISNYRWTICAMLFFATTINYLDRQVLSLTWKDFIAPEFHWTDNHYGTITAVFSLVYAIGMLFAGRVVDKLGTKKGFLVAIFIWSIGACLHAFCGIATMWWVNVDNLQAMKALDNIETVSTVINVSVALMVFARIVLAIGESGNFPAAIKATAEYFPKKDRAFATSIFNAGATVGALAAPLTIPVIAKQFGWEASFIIIGALGFVWMGFWIFVYKKPHVHPKVNKSELAYILQDTVSENPDGSQDALKVSADEKKIPFRQCFKYRQTWAFAIGKFLTDGVWWFFLFWTPAYLSDVYGMKTSDHLTQYALFVLYAVTLLSIIGGWLPSYFVKKRGMNPYAARMRAMLIFAFFPLLALFAQPFGYYSFWFPIVIIGIAAAAHQSWSANIFSTVGDMFPKSAIATVTGIGGMAGGVSAFIINKSSGLLFTYAEKTNMQFLGFEGKASGYFMIFIYCALAYLVAWAIMKMLVPKYKPV